MSKGIVISVKNVSKDFVLPHEKITSIKSAVTGVFRRNRGKEKQHALRDISFEVKKGEFFGIVGRNGSGKSTMLKILANIYQPTKGSVHTEGKLVPFIELGVGFNPELTGRENVYLNGAMLGFSRSEVDAMYDDIVGFAELERFMDQKLKNYSSGMQVRLAFSVATHANADILLVDEVLAVGDADFQRKCFQYFRQLKREKKTVIFVSHDMQAMREYCDRCIMIDESKLLYEGSADFIAEKYIQLFNEDNGEVHQDKDSDRWGDGAARFGELDVHLSEEYLLVRAEITFARPMDGPILGISIKNSSGVSVCGTNTKILKQKVGSMGAGSKIQVGWNIPNIFSDDIYTIEVAVTYSDGVTQADWWHGAASVSIKNDETTPHVVSPKIEVTLS
ncbi:MAG: ABC transporter ATP-binding protein [Candidatus Saccharimonadales bacterium]